MHEIFVIQIKIIVVHGRFGIRIPKPYFSVWSISLVKGQIDSLVILYPCVYQIFAVLFERVEILLGLFISRGTETFVVLDFPILDLITKLLGPNLEIVQSEEALGCLTLFGFHGRKYEFSQKIVRMDKRGPEFVNKIYHKPFPLRAIGVLVCHYHY